MDPVVHFELPYDDRARIMRFYADVFGWRLEPFQDDYVLATTTSGEAAAGTAAGGIDGGLFRRDPGRPGQHPSVVIAVQDIEAAMAQVCAAGGEVFGEPQAIPGVGRYVAFRDTEGNRLSLLEPLPAGA